MSGGHFVGAVEMEMMMNEDEWEDVTVTLVTNEPQKKPWSLVFGLLVFGLWSPGLWSPGLWSVDLLVFGLLVFGLWSPGLWSLVSWSPGLWSPGLWSLVFGLLIFWSFGKTGGSFARTD